MTSLSLKKIVTLLLLCIALLPAKAEIGVDAVCITPDGKFSFSHLYQDSVVYQWDNTTKSFVRKYSLFKREKYYKPLLTATSDSKFLVIGEAHGTMVVDVTNGKVRHLPLVDGRATVNNQIVGQGVKSEQRKATGYFDSKSALSYYDAASGSLVKTIDFPEEIYLSGLRGESFSKDGKRMTLRTSKELRVIDIEQVKVVATLKFKDLYKHKYALNNTGTSLVIGYEEKDCEVYNVETKKVVSKIHYYPIWFCGFSPDDKHVFASTYKQMALWDWSKPKPEYAHEIFEKGTKYQFNHKEAVSGLVTSSTSFHSDYAWREMAFSEDGAWMVAGTDKGFPILIETKSRKLWSLQN
ncbi:MAG: WD40 repeat domain-containing protein [Hymenobacteraceae bacterium]|nr:WD40 repeat domain-containing protein [Hymenobacteraceae bacterium]MDX5396707.1 WD40 repeat domain-containing protein [Hymenobacteraceae bacterium]MDX5512767.1 WD40 repeat domain-containing protein [Hymenobacteraceae bacterium]